MIFSGWFFNSPALRAPPQEGDAQSDEKPAKNLRPVGVPLIRGQGDLRHPGRHKKNQDKAHSPCIG